VSGSPGGTVKFHQALGREADHLAEHIGVRTLSQYWAKMRHVICQRGSPLGVTGLISTSAKSHAAALDWGARP
jgi:hypothetical protein